MTASLHLRFETEALRCALNEVSSVAAKLPPEFVERLVRLVDAGTELFVIETDCLAAAGANHLVMRAKPTDALLAFVAAAGAPDPDLGLVDNALCHIEASLPVGMIANGEGHGEAAR